jgi:hypothetical protein
MSDTPLKRHDTSVILMANPSEVTEIEHAGPAGFKLKNHMRMYTWIERGKTWNSATLDRIDATKDQFSRAAKGGGKTP